MKLVVVNSSTGDSPYDMMTLESLFDGKREAHEMQELSFGAPAVELTTDNSAVSISSSGWNSAIAAAKHLLTVLRLGGTLLLV